MVIRYLKIKNSTRRDDGLQSVTNRIKKGIFQLLPGRMTGTLPRYQCSLEFWGGVGAQAVARCELNPHVC